MSSATRFAAVELGPPIEVFELTRDFNADDFPNKVSLGAGTYRTDEGKPWVLPVVKKVEAQMASDDTLNHEYLPVLGMEALSSLATKLLLGPNSNELLNGKAFGVQCLSGTGSLRVGAEFLSKVLGYKTYYYSKPTWENHVLVFNNAGFTSGKTYRYWDPKTKGVDIDGMIEDLSAAPENSVIILHACAHNPTGCDPSQEDWEKIAAVVRDRKLFPFFDSAYQGFASGDIDKDAWAVRFFANAGFELFCAQSFAKNFGLYNERTGNLTVLLNDPTVAARVKSQLTLIVRGMYSNPPNHGARIVATVLNNPKLFEEWTECVKIMSYRIKDMREALHHELLSLNTPGTWDHIVKQIGMFSYTGLSPRQVEHLIEKYHIYLLKSGRISMCGLTKQNVKYVAQAINEAIASFPDV